MSDFKQFLSEVWLPAIGIAIFLTLLYAGGSLFVGLMTKHNDTAAKAVASYKEACVKSGGVPGWNGRAWECLK